MTLKSNKNEPFKTVLTICVSLLLLNFFTKWHWTFTLSLIIGIFSLVSNVIAIRIDAIWMQLSRLLSLVSPTILLTIIFYFFLTPIALLSRFFGEKNQLKLKNTEKSLFKNCNKSFEKESFEKPW